MSSVNVLPSAPHEDSHLYPQLQPDFRMQKVNEISAALNKEVSHYRAVAKKYKRAKKVVNWSAAGSSVLSVHFQARVLAPLFCWSSCHNSTWWHQWSICSSFFGADNRQQKA